MSEQRSKLRSETLESSESFSWKARVLVAGLGGGGILPLEAVETTALPVRAVTSTLIYAISGPASGLASSS